MGVKPGEPSQAPITHDSMRAYYGCVRTVGKRIPHEYGETLRDLADLSPELLDEFARAPESDSTLDVDVEQHLTWLETGSGEPLPSSRS